MRFLAKRRFFSAGISVLWLAMAGMYLVLWLIRFRSPHHFQYAFQAALWMVLALLNFFLYKSIYWELDDEGIREHKLWWTSQKTRWQDVMRVVSAWSSSYDLKIEYDRLGAGSNFGRILASPADRDQFLEAVRHFAPQAEFVDESSKRTLLA